MKKLITVLAAAVFGTCAWATTFTQSIQNDIVDMTNGQLVVGYDMTGKSVTSQESDVHWWATNWSVSASYEQPATVVTDSTGNYLNVETDSGYPVLRTFSKMTETGAGTKIYQAAPVDIDAHGLFVDTTVQFTGSDTAPNPGDGKLLVWLRTIEADDTAVPPVVGSTNLMVTCGVMVQEVLTPTNYVLNTTIDPTAWYRLTVRADQGSAYTPTFKIYLNDALLTATVDETEMSAFPSLVKGASYINLASVGYEGTGKIKSVDLLTPHDAPAFAKDPTCIKINWTTGVAGFTVASLAGSQVITVSGAGSTNLIVAAGANTVTPTYVQSPLYELDTFTDVKSSLGLTESEGVASITVTEFSTVNDSELTITAKQSRKGAQLWINGEKVSGDFPFVKDVVAYVKANSLAGSAFTVKLLLDETGNDFGDWTYLTDATLDLNGHTIEATSKGAGYGLIRVGATGEETIEKDTYKLTIVDTSANGGGTIKGIIDDDPIAAWWAIYNDRGTVTIENATGTNPIKIWGLVYNIIEDDAGEAWMTIKGGKFNPIVKLVPDYVSLLPAKTWSAEPGADGYYTIVDAKYELTVSGGNNASITVDGKAYTAALQVTNGTYTIAATPKSGYTYDGVTLGEGWTLVDGNATYTATVASEALEVTAPDAKQASGGFAIIIAATEPGQPATTNFYDTFAAALNEATAGQTITVMTSAAIPAGTEINKVINIALNGQTLAIAASTNNADVAVSGAGTLTCSGDLTVNAVLDLSALTYQQVPQEGAGYYFVIGATGKVIFPQGPSYPDMALAVKSAADGAKIVTSDKGSVYTKSGDLWVVGESGAAVAKIGTTGYTTFAAAYTAAKAGETLTLLADLPLTSTLDVDKAITLDLGTKTVTLCASAARGVEVKAAATIKNGKIVSSTETDFGGFSSAVRIYPNIAATFEDLEIDGAHYRFVISCDSTGGAQVQAEFDAAPTAKVTCKNVDVKGNGTLFYAQHTLLDLDANCSATAEGTASTAEGYHAAIYSALNSIVTVAGGTYANTNALVTGNLGGKIVINGGTLTGDIKSYMYKGDDRFTNNVATIEITGGTVNGDFVFANDQPAACTKDEVKWNITGGTFSVDPSSYVAQNHKAIKDEVNNVWNVVETYEVKDVTAKGGSLSFNPYNPAAGETVTVTPYADNGYTFQDDSIVVDGSSIKGNSFTMPAKKVEVSATFTANNYNVTVAQGIENGTVSVDRNTATVEDTVTVTATPATNYRLVTITVNGSPISGNTFTVPAANAEVSAVFELDTYTITVAAVEHADVKVYTNDVATAAWTAAGDYAVLNGTKVVVTYTAQQGYKLTGDTTFTVNSVTEAQRIPAQGSDPVPSKDDPVAKIGDKGYDTLEAAFADAKAAAVKTTIVMQKSIDITDTLAINGGDIILDLNDQTITAKKSSYAITIEDTTLVISNGNLNATVANAIKINSGAVTVAVDATMSSTAVYFIEIFGGTVDINGTVTGGTEGNGPVTVRNTCVLNVNDGAVMSSPSSPICFKSEIANNAAQVFINEGATLSSTSAYSVFWHGKATDKSTLTIRGGKLSCDRAIFRETKTDGVSNWTVTPLTTDCKALFSKIDIHYAEDPAGSNWSDVYPVSDYCADGYAPKQITEGEDAGYYYIERQYKVLFVNGDVITTNKVWAGETTTAPADPTPATGYTFDGWYNGNVKFDPAAAVNADATYTAKFTAIEYTIRLALNGATAPAGWTALIEGFVGTNVTIETPAFNLPALTKENYEFKGYVKNGETATNEVVQISGVTASADYVACFIQTAPSKISLTFTINANVTDVLYVIGEETVTNTLKSTQTIEVDKGTVVKVADVYYAVGYIAADAGEKKGTTATINATTGWTFSAKAISSPSDLPADVTAKEAGITNPAFQSDTPTQVKAAVGWQTTYSSAGANINNAQFVDRVPQNAQAEAYLLNCSPEANALENAKKEFKFTSFDPSKVPSIGEGGKYGNGIVIILGAPAVDGPWSEPAANSQFYKGTLVK